MPPVAVFGRATLALWGLAFAAFFVPEGIAVLALSRRYPGEGGVYLWARRHFGDVHGFVSGWCYWTNNLFYVPVLLVYLAGIVAFAGGERSAALVDDRWFVATDRVRLAGDHHRRQRARHGRRQVDQQRRRHRQPPPTVVLLVVAAAVARRQGVAATPPLVAGSVLDMASGLGVMCFAFIGIELASTMADEIRQSGARRSARHCHHRRHRHRVVPAGDRRAAGAGAVERARRDSGRHAGGEPRRERGGQRAGSWRRSPS